jgi:hypothetical protein
MALLFGIGMPVTDIKSVAGTAQTADDWTLIFRAIRDRLNELTSQASTTTPLAAGATYTSAVFTCAGFARIVGTVYADQAGTLYVEQSADGTNFDSSSSFSVSAGAPFGFTVEVVAPNARIRYVNGATAQTVFRLYAFTRRI